MRDALRQLLSDFLSAIVFLVVFGLGGGLYLATGLAVAVSLIQVIVLKLRGKPIDLMQWLILGLVVVLGAASILTQDSRFIMVKPSIIHAAIGAVMLRPGWMLRYLPPIVRDNLSESVIVRVGYAWAALMFTLAAINLVIVAAFDFRVWAWFIGVGAMGAKVAAFLLQYAWMRTTIRRKMRQSAVPPLAAGGTP
jgi:intracellular septation protein A